MENEFGSFRRKRRHAHLRRRSASGFAVNGVCAISAAAGI
jgi:hypothetical protein